MFDVGVSIQTAPIGAFAQDLPSEKRTGRSPSLTLLDLVEAVAESCESEIEVIATIRHLLSSGRVRLQACELPL